MFKITDYETIAKKFAMAEERLFELLEQVAQGRRDARAANYQDRELTARFEVTFAAAKKQQKGTQELLDALKAAHRVYWQKEFERQMADAREALVPLVRAAHIAYRALREPGAGHAPTWIGSKLGPMVIEIAELVSRETHDLPLDPPESFALVRAADDELLTY